MSVRPNPRALRIVPIDPGAIIQLGPHGGFVQVWRGQPVITGDTMWLTIADHEALRRAPDVAGAA